MPIPTYEAWMEDTALGLMKPRSSALKAVDESIRNYWAAPQGDRNRHAAEIRRNFQAWLKLKGGDVFNSERNHSLALSALQRAIDELQLRDGISPEEREAHRWYEQQRRERMARIFEGRTLRLRWRCWEARRDTEEAVRELKHHQANHEAEAARQHAQQRVDNRNAYRPNLALDVVNPIGNLAFAARGVANGAGSQGHQAGEQMLVDMFGGDVSSPFVQEHLTLSGFDVKELVSSVIPLVSYVAGGVRTLIAIGKYARAWQQQADTLTHGGQIDWGGDMASAFSALEVMLERKRSSAGELALIQGSEFAVRTALLAADMTGVSGSVVGMVGAFAKLAHRLMLLGRDYRESKAANRLLADPANLDGGMFEANPLLGCYMLVCSDTSEVIQVVRNALHGRGIVFGAEGWQDDVEKMKREHVDPVLSRAASFIYGAAYEIPDMPLHAMSNPGILDKAGKWMNRSNFAGNLIRGAALIA